MPVPCLKQPHSCPCPEPDQSSPRPQMLLQQDRFSYYMLTSTARFSEWPLSRWGLPTNTLCAYLLYQMVLDSLILKSSQPLELKIVPFLKINREL